MIIKNVKIYTEEQRFVPGAVVTQGDRIRRVACHTEEPLPECGDVLDGGGCFCIPGMIDLHFHGCRGRDFCDGTREALETISEYEASIGVTAIAPATMTLPAEQLRHVLSQAASYRREQRNGTAARGADLVGINMEGPFISRVKKGAQDERYILPSDAAVFRSFQRAADGLVRFIGIAPEEGDATAFIKAISREVSVALAHTNADYSTAMRAFDAGANHVVHLYNAMTPFSHRAPGVVGAAADSAHVMSELICDGLHVHPSAVRAAVRMMGAERIVFISDSMRAAGMPDGSYTLGGLDVTVRDGRAVLASDGTLAGSVATLPDCVRTAVKQMHIPLETAIACATINPAKSLGIESLYGSIAAGKKADLVLWDADLHQKHVIKDGSILV